MYIFLESEVLRGNQKPHFSKSLQKVITNKSNKIQTTEKCGYCCLKWKGKILSLHQL